MPTSPHILPNILGVTCAQWADACLEAQRSGDATDTYRRAFREGDTELVDLGPVAQQTESDSPEGTVLKFTQAVPGKREGDASAHEWRTPPLWGVGLTEVVSGHRFFLHDGRARGLEEAILWHGGEAQAARDAFAALPKTERDRLIAFVSSL